LSARAGDNSSPGSRSSRACEVSSLRGIKQMEFSLSIRRKVFVRCWRDGVPHREGCDIEINARTGIIYGHVIPAGLGGEPTRV
jgi:hypothetical protein